MSASPRESEPNFVMVPPDPLTQSAERLRRQALRLLTEMPADSDAHRAEPAPGRSGQAQRDEGMSASPASSMIVGILAMPAVFLAIVFVALAAFGRPGDFGGAVAGAADPLEQPLQARGQSRAQARALAPSLVSASSDARGVISLSDDARIQSIALDGDRIALHVEGPGGREILVYDYREGRQIATAAIETFATEATDTLSMLTGPPPPVVAPEVSAPEALNPEPRTAFAGAPTLKPRSLP